ncbi:MAG: prepilin-type N-terminal cleavage/methylation domain-containing protein [Nitrospina sp.]|jgi:prepilin-type N-terminal cleavage/methylation domain-containing protein|nr:prepilin-type N-terminal cleavage/methylation domain-containing protein [Nitrospina sp.]
MNHLKHNSGMSLIEILIAVAIAGFGLLAYAMLSGSVIEKNAESKKSTVAVTLAQDKTEEIKDLATRILLSDANGLDSPVYDSGTNSWTPTAGGEIIDAEGNTGTSAGHYTRTWTINLVGSATYITDMTVTVKWDNGSESKSLTTRITQ